MFTWYADADEKVEIVLACDPSLQEANDEKTLEKYLIHGDDDGLIVPEEASKFVIKPLTPAELSKARRSAGRPSVLGDEIRGKLQSGEIESMDDLSDEEYKAMVKAAEFEERFYDAMRDAGIVSTPWEDTSLEGLRPAGLQIAVKNELIIHIMRITNMTPEGKAPSA